MRLTKEGFISYLKAHRGTYFHSANATQCPIASYLKSIGYTNVVVGSRGMDYYRGGKAYRDVSIPAWAVKFIYAFDGANGYKHRGSKVLKIMEEI